MEKAEVVALMESSNSIIEWHQNLAKVKAAFNGEKPDFWHEAIFWDGVSKRFIAKLNGK